MKPRFAPLAGTDFRKPAPSEANKKLNPAGEIPKPEPAVPQPDQSALRSSKMPRRLPAAGESKYAKKDGAPQTNFPQLSKSELREFIKLHFPPGTPLPEIK